MTSDATTRRKYLRALGLTGTAILAGCSSRENNDGETSEPSSGDDDGAETTTDGETIPPTRTLTPTDSNGATNESDTQEPTDESTDTPETTVTVSEPPESSEATEPTVNGEQVAKVAASDGDESDFFGVSVALDGDTALVSANGDEGPDGEPKGSVYVFTADGGTWSQQAKLTADDGTVFGSTAAVSGDTAFVEARVAEGGSTLGAVDVFTRTDGVWSRQTTLTADDGDSDDDFGKAIAIEGEMVFVGAPGDDDPNGTSAGSAYVFERDGETWSQQAKLAADDGTSYDSFGSSIALDGDTALIGAVTAESGDGAAYVFTRNGSWSQQAKLTGEDGEMNDSFGTAVALEGDTALIGDSNDDVDGDFNAGSTYVFARDGESWSQQARLTDDDGDEDDQFGGTVGINGNTAVIGAYNDEDPNGDNAGSAYVFTGTGGEWSQRAKLIADDGDSFDLFGVSVALDGDTAVIGASTDEDPNGREAGSAYVFDV